MNKLTIMLRHEMRHISRVIPAALLTPSLHTAEDKMLDPMLCSGVDEVPSLRLLLMRRQRSEREDGVNILMRREDGFRVLRVALHDLEVQHLAVLLD